MILPLALALSCVGDIFLQLDFRRYFVHGLAAFLLAHLTYIVLFTRSWPRPLRPDLGRLTVPALVYAAAVTAMTMSAILAGFSRPFVWIGALLFLFSDSLLAAGRFKVALPLAAFLIWPTYYLGQSGITLGFLGEKAADDRGL